MFQSFKRVAVLMTLLLGAAAALAQSGTAMTNNYDVNLSNDVTVNSCSAGEPVALSGTVHIQSSVTTDSTGVSSFTVTAADQLTGVGQNTATSYLASDSDDYSSNTSDGSVDMTVELRSQLKSGGTAPSLMLVQVLHITADSTGNLSAQVVSNSTSCGS
jgi:hypothetical protein